MVMQGEWRALTPNYLTAVFLTVMKDQPHYGRADLKLQIESCFCLKVASLKEKRRKKNEKREKALNI